MNRRAAVGAVAALVIAAGATTYVVRAQSDGTQFPLGCSVNGRDITCHGQLPEVTSSTSSSPPTTPPSSVPASTSSRPSPTTTTTSTTTTSPPPASTEPSTSTPPSSSSPAGVLFSEQFSTASSLGRFDYDLHSGGCCDQPLPMEPLAADHDMNCGDPNTTHRDLPGGPVPAPGRTGPFVGPMDYVYHCTPGGDPAKAHMMTAYQTLGYVILSFSPKQSFDAVHRVCWSINATDEGGGKWTNMVAVPASAVKAKAPGWGTGPRLDFILDPDLDSSATPLPANSLAVKDFRGTIAVQVDGNEVFYNGVAHVTADKAARYKHCVEQTGPNTIRITVDRPGGGTDVFTVAGRFPVGATRIIFQDDSYNPDKHEGTNGQAMTWHWDDIEVS